MMSNLVTTRRFTRLSRPEWPHVDQEFWLLISTPLAEKYSIMPVSLSTSLTAPVME
jgi:hypothetical protein